MALHPAKLACRSAGGQVQDGSVFDVAFSPRQPSTRLPHKPRQEDFEVSQWTKAQADAHNAKVAKLDRMASEVFPGAVALKPQTTNAAPGIKIRQGDKPPNKLEAAWFEYLKLAQPNGNVRAQSIRFRLANGAWYKPDFGAWQIDGRLHCWETKGGKRMKGHAKGMLTIKVAAALWPEVRFFLVWKDESRWQTQEVLP